MMAFLFENSIPLFIILFIIYFLLNKIFKVQLSEKSQNNFFATYLEQTLKNYNISFSLFILVIYICTVLLPFIIFRLSRIGLFEDICFLTFSFNLKFMLAFFFAILSFVYFFKIVNFIAYRYILQLHFYLYYYSEKYVTFAENTFFKEKLLFNYILNISIIFRNLTQNNKEFITDYKSELNFFSEDVLKKKWLLYLQIRSLLHRTFLLKCMFRIVSILLGSLYFHISRFLFFMPYSITVISVLLDLDSGFIFYTYYGLFYFIITNIIKKIRKFYYEKDPLLDIMLSKYLYSDYALYQKLYMLLKENDYMRLLIFKIENPNEANIINNIPSLTKYIKNDFKNHFIINDVKASNEKYIMNMYKRLHILMILLLVNFYIIFYNKFTVIAFDISFNFCIISIIIWFLLYYLHRNITKETMECWVEYINFKKYFNLIIVSYIILLSYLLFRNKISFNVYEVLLNFKDIIIIKENFTFSEKYTYLNKYIKYLINDSKYDQKILMQVLQDIKTKDYIQNCITLEDIKNLIHDLYKKATEKTITNKTVMVKILEYLKKQ